VDLSSILPEPFVTFAAAHPTRVPRQIARYWNMQSRKLLPRRPPRTIDAERRLVISLTTMPSRMNQLQPVLNSLIDQDAPADAIVLAVPRMSRREKVPYVVPDFLRASDAVTVLDSELDWGPATKLIPALRAEKRPDTLILFLDDDNIYPRDLVSNFLAWHRRFPDEALGYRGWSVPESLDTNKARVRFATTISSSIPVDVVTGTWGVLVQPQFFDQHITDYAGYPPEAFFVDDIWFNGHLARAGVPRRLVTAINPPLPTRASIVNALGVAENADGTKNNRVVRAFEPYWACRQRADEPLAQTAAS
jgi:hypothetical protein